jgi:hypothetical protein
MKRVLSLPMLWQVCTVLSKSFESFNIDSYGKILCYFLRNVYIIFLNSLTFKYYNTGQILKPTIILKLFSKPYESCNA